MADKHVLPREIRKIIDLLVRDDAGQESEGINPANHVEDILKTGKLDSEYFGEHFPYIGSELKIRIGIEILYEAILSKLGLNLGVPSNFMDYDGVDQPMTTKRHLTQLNKLFEILEKVNRIGSPLRID